MNDDIFESVSQRSDGAQDAENSRIAAIADELQRLCRLYETQSGASQSNGGCFEVEQRVAEQYSKSVGMWIPMEDVFNLGIPGDRHLYVCLGLYEREQRRSVF